jgi:hypothetical protein
VQSRGAAHPLRGPLRALLGDCLASHG